MPLKIVGKIDAADRAYVEAVLTPLLHEPFVEYLGEIGEAEKAAVLGHASALLFPIDWPEAFGVVMIEAMACGTPIIAYRQGSVPEVMEEGVTGFVVEDLEAAVKAVERVSGIDRARCRQVFDARFSVARMAQDYLRMYRRLVA
jgi:glycosyltransferase involved in cell wall biosynthesis